MIPSLALAALLPALAAAIPCIQFDADDNLYAFGGDEDVALGTSDAWASPSPKQLSTDGRPPWNGNFSQCLLSRNANALYVLGADASDAGAIYIYDFAGNAWTKQATTGGSDALQNSRSSAILDHNTNVIFTVGSSSMYTLDFGSVTATAAGSLAWGVASTPKFASEGYKVTAAAASNHINYFGVPGSEAGSTDMFIVHYNAWQPQPAKYTAVGGNNFPAQSGQAVSLATANSTLPPYQMLFVPNDLSSSFIVTHYTADWSWNDTTRAPMAVSLVNSTQELPAPTAKDTEASYACSETHCVQMDTQGNIYYINAVGADYTVTPGAKWDKMSYKLTPYVAPTPTGTNPSGSATGSGGASASNPAASPAGSSSGARTSLNSGILGAVLGVAALAIATIA
ncbi:hypothetical protein CspeluHIS016_0111990 [Cutaneotrichosporon spelunceum]|uniref:Galactose oxidase n=1 Tax=Cutaneotrichosporon spelunceum TaxID=1672016 RepID=A0AAD3TPH7_9TREE|nr:hypothetical protein CspeluHIS016_0111990 [Cutaneotrichosporon spelunceum]